MAGPSPFGAEREALLRDLRGRRSALVSLERLVRAYRRPWPGGHGGPPDGDVSRRAEVRQLRAAVHDARKALDEASNTINALVELRYWNSPLPLSDAVDAIRRLVEGLERWDVRDLTLPNGRPSVSESRFPTPATLIAQRRRWIAEHTIARLQAHALNFRPARYGRLKRLL